MDQPITPAPDNFDPQSAEQQYAAYYAQQAQQQAAMRSVPPQTPSKMSAGWKVVIGIVLVSLLGICGLCGLIAVMIPSDVGPSGDAVALIHVTGVISGTGSSVNGVVTPENMLALLAAAENDDSVEAVLLRIDSPGGTVAASEEISTEIARMTKPVVASIGDVGASGAYMIASQCDEIVALRTSAVGSIGVISEVMNLEELMEKVGVDFTVITAGEYKDAGSPYRSLTETETALIEQSVDGAYQEFIDVVARGRGLERSAVEEMATGWVWSGVEAQEMGLVDTLGTFNDAVDRAADLGGIKGDPHIVTYDEYDPFDLIWSLLGITDRLSPTSALDGEATFRRALPR